MRTIAHISDLHFGRIDLQVAETLLAELVDLAPSLVVISGDLVQRARERHFRAARAFLDRLPAPWFVVPGNHDIPAYNLIARFSSPFHNYKTFITPDLNPFIADDEVALLGLNTARPLILNFAHGRINPKQVARIETAFRGLPATVFKIVVTHHPFLPPPNAGGRTLMGRANLALPALEVCGVDLLLAGHHHCSFSGAVPDNHPQIARSILVAHAATATSTRLRNEPNSYNIITIEPSRVRFRVRSWTDHGFATTDRSTYTRSHHRWLPEDPAGGAGG